MGSCYPGGDPRCKSLLLNHVSWHLEICCGVPEHMTEEDVVLVNGFRKAVDGDMTEEMEEIEGVEVVEWWELMGWDEEGTVETLKRKKVEGPDGVHLPTSANRSAAVSLCYRLAEKEVMISGGGVTAKKRCVT